MMLRRIYEGSRRQSVCRREPCRGFIVAVIVFAIHVAAKAPIVKWAQKSDKLWLSMVVPEVSEPRVVVEQDFISFDGISKGTEYSVDIPLLRGINSTESKYEIHNWSIEFELKKLRSEPCWMRLMKKKGTTPGWLKKNRDKWDTDDCQQAKEKWREAYFAAKLEGREPNKKKPEETSEASSGGGGGMDTPEKEAEKKAWQETVNDWRNKGVRRKSTEEKSRGRAVRKGKKSEL